MNKKMLRNIIVSVLVLAVLGGAYYFVMKIPEKTEEEPEATPAYTVNEILNLKTDDILEINITNEKNSFTVVRKEENNFFVKEYQDLNFSNSKLNSVFYDFASVNYESEITEEGDYGFLNPGAVTNITMTDGTVHVLSLGNKVSGANSYFLKYSDKIYVVSEYEGKNLLKELNSLRDTNIATIDNQSISAFKLDKKGQNVVDIRAIKEEEQGNFTQMTSYVMTSPKYMSVSMDEFPKILESLTSVTAIDFAEDNTSAKYGIGKLVLTVTDSENTHKILYGDTDDEGNVYAQLEGTNFVFLTSGTLYEQLWQLNPQSLMDKFVLLVNIEKVNTVEFFGGNKNYQLIINGEGESSAYFINDKTVYEDDFKKAYQEIIGITTNGLNESNKGSDVEYTIIYTYKDGNQDVIEFKSYDERNYAVFINDKSEFIILKKKLSAAMENVEEYFKK